MFGLGLDLVEAFRNEENAVRVSRRHDITAARKWRLGVDPGSSLASSFFPSNREPNSFALSSLRLIKVPLFGSLPGCEELQVPELRWASLDVLGGVQFPELPE